MSQLHEMQGSSCNSIDIHGMESCTSKVSAKGCNSINLCLLQKAAQTNMKFVFHTVGCISTHEHNKTSTAFSSCTLESRSTIIEVGLATMLG